jgi:hypothetical protein
MHHLWLACKRQAACAAIVRTFLMDCASSRMTVGMHGMYEKLMTS